MDGVINLLGRQATAAHRHVMAMKNLTDRPPFDTELNTQLCDSQRTPSSCPGTGTNSVSNTTPTISPTPQAVVEIARSTLVIGAPDSAKTPPPSSPVSGR
jgi:hypothetical protein